MKKTLRLVLMIALSLTVIGTGVWAAITVSQQTKSSVTFTATNVYVDISGTCSGGSVKEYAHIADNPETTNTITQPTAWEIGAVELDSETLEVTYTFVFTNKAETKAGITIKTPTGFTTDTQLGLSGGLRAGTEDAYTYSGDTVLLAAKDDTATFVYTIKVQKDFDKSITEAIEANFEVSMVKA